jgi:hypothetical protein
LIENFWEVAVILIAAFTGLVGAGWKLFSNVDNHRTKYRDDEAALRAILITNELLPELLKFSNGFEEFRKKHPLEEEKVLESQESSRRLKIILQITRKIVDIEGIVKEIQVKCGDCAYDLLGLAIVPAAFLAIVFFEPDIIYSYSVLVFLVVLSIKTIYDFVKYRKRIRLLITKDNEIRENW